MASTTCARSPELSSLIISHLAPEPLITSQDAPESLAVYATVSEEWRQAVERRTFSKLHLTSFRLADSARIVTGPRRRLVRCIEFDIVLDAYGNEACSEYETPEEQTKNNSDFTEAVKALFSHLSTWPEEQVSKSGIELSIMAYSPSDLFRLPGKDRNGELGTGYTRFIWAGSASIIASRLPRLQDLEFSLWDSEKRNLSLRKTARGEFAHGMRLLPPTIKKLWLNYPYTPPADQTFMPPDITQDSGSDPLSNSLRTFSQQLTSIYIEHIVISSEFFWPLGSNAEPKNAPYWPHLTTLGIFFMPVTPSGLWLFERDPAEEIADDDENRRDLSLHYEPDRLPLREDWHPVNFRLKPNERLMNDFYLAVGHAVGHMPCLRELDLQAEQGRGINHTLEFKVTETTASLTISSATPFELEETVLNVWRESASKNRGAELEIECLLNPLHRGLYTM